MPGNGPTSWGCVSAASVRASDSKKSICACLAAASRLHWQRPGRPGLVALRDYNVDIEQIGLSPLAPSWYGRSRYLCVTGEHCLPARQTNKTEPMLTIKLLIVSHARYKPKQQSLGGHKYMPKISPITI